jgi:hypothetical protein
MAHLPSSTIGRIYVVILVAAAIPLLIWVGVTLSGPVVWLSLGIVTFLVTAILLRRRQLEAARERAYDPTLGFTNVVARMRADNALADAQRAEQRAGRTASNDA